jgi:hypothetical protein
MSTSGHAHLKPSSNLSPHSLRTEHNDSRKSACDAVVAPVAEQRVVRGSVALDVLNGNAQATQLRVHYRSNIGVFAFPWPWWRGNRPIDTATRQSVDDLRSRLVALHRDARPDPRPYRLHWLFGSLCERLRGLGNDVPGSTAPARVSDCDAAECVQQHWNTVCDPDGEQYTGLRTHRSIRHGDHIEWTATRNHPGHVDTMNLGQQRYLLHADLHGSGNTSPIFTHRLIRIGGSACKIQRSNGSNRHTAKAGCERVADAGWARFTTTKERQGGLHIDARLTEEARHQ